MNHHDRTVHPGLAPLFTAALLFCLFMTPAARAATPAEQQAEAPLRQFRDELQTRLDGLSAVARDYAHWNDAWRFATGARARFPGEGLLAPALARVGVRHMLVLDRNQRTRLSLAIGSATAAPAVVAPDPVLREALRRAIEGNTLQSREASLQAVANIGGELSLVVARPVMRESGADTPGGWLAFAQPLTGETLDLLLRLLGPSARAFPAEALEGTQLAPALRRIETAGAWADIFSDSGDQLIESWLVLRGFDGQPLWAVRLDTRPPQAPAAAPAVARDAARPGSGIVDDGGGRGGAGVVLMVLLFAAAALAAWMWRARRAAPSPTPRSPGAPASPKVAHLGAPASRRPAPRPRPALAPAPATAAAPVPAATPAPATVSMPPPPRPAPTLPDAADILETAPDGVLVAALDDGRIVRANPAALRLFGLSETELKTQGVNEILRVPPEQTGTTDTRLRLDTPLQHVRRVILDASGRVRDIEVSVAPLKGGTRPTAALFLREAGPRTAERALTRVQADHLSVHYQPIIDLHSERICALEALPLWKDTQHGWIHPDDPLVVADGGSALGIARYVLAQVSRDLLRWRDQGATLVPVSINVAPSASDRGDFEAALRDTQARGVGPALLQLEISDSALRDSRSGLLRADVLEQWRALQLPVIVDHFGQRGRTADPVGTEAVKLDPNLVRDIATHAPDRDAVEAILARAQPRGITVIAEGVDRWQQLEALRALGCRQAQGPLFSRAVDADEALRLLREERIVILAQDPLEATDELPALRLVKP